ncbi:hypothetical protein AKJ09_10950 [Labilithrix luteola]|uniref:Uncharacterized protein n=1 Tax=Labilithrix luteola TaxID=1391654 RepID=A0A0K1QF65_9BACT|nr:hypothetical protein [Labilithrix luteola]AKV04287.1 hypothetical protein AKJ09_10950 [Labilithrix luteola]
MSLPPARLRDENPDIARVLQALDGEGPDPSVIAKVLALPESVPVPAARPSALNAMSATARWILMGSCVVSLGVFGLATTKILSKSAPAAVPSAVLHEDVVTLPPPSPPPSDVASGSLPTFTVDDLPSAAPPAPAVSVRSSPSAAPAASTFHEELALVEGARAALTRGDGQSALAILDRYDANFPSGALASEAAIARIEALARLGRADAARDAAQRFLAHNAASPYAARVRAILDRLRDAEPSSDTDRKGLPR